MSSLAPILSTRCSAPGSLFWFGRARLYPDHITITGWTARGFFTRTIQIDTIRTVQWWAVQNDVNFIITLQNETTVAIRLNRDAGTWNYKLHELMGQSLLEQHELPGVPMSEVA